MAPYCKARFTAQVVKSSGAIPQVGQLAVLVDIASFDTNMEKVFPGLNQTPQGTQIKLAQSGTYQLEVSFTQQGGEASTWKWIVGPIGNGTVIDHSAFGNSDTNALAPQGVQQISYSTSAFFNSDALISLVNSSLPAVDAHLVTKVSSLNTECVGNVVITYLDA